MAKVAVATTTKEATPTTMGTKVQARVENSTSNIGPPKITTNEAIRTNIGDPLKDNTEEVSISTKVGTLIRIILMFRPLWARTR